MPRIRWKAQVTSQDLAPLIQTAGKSIAAIQAAIEKHQAFVPYNAGGAQQAVTTVTWPPAAPVAYATTMQEHSEMVSLGASTAAPAPIWSVNAGGHVVANNGAAIAGANYFTNLPHCGYCTVMLWVLNLPLGAPTAGRYNLAVNLEYTVPANVANNVDALSRLINGNAGGNAALIALKKMVNVFLQNAPADWVLQIGAVFVSDTAVTAAAPAGKLVLDWSTEAAPHNVDVNVQHFGRNSLLTTLWKVVYQGIYDHVQ
ncbi:hypothetical protein [uncultured Hoeflea sp.]|uniref:hypothetical protein n=1 Tax=uncultured Hoeflea sp. TaxID=538666 RepID=UPI002629F337|nr:hypothetical protein [uncultured Hoeflea sp.]